MRRGKIRERATLARGLLRAWALLWKYSGCGSVRGFCAPTASWHVAALGDCVCFRRWCFVHKRVRSWSVWLQWAVLLSVLAGALAWGVGAAEGLAGRGGVEKGGREGG